MGRQGGWTALHWACDKGHLHVARALLDLAASTEKTDNVRTQPTPYYSVLAHDAWIIWACRPYDGSTHYCTCITQAPEAPCTPLPQKNWTALHWAAHSGRLAVAELLLARGANRGALSNDGKTAQQMAEAKDEAGHASVAALLSGASPVRVGASCPDACPHSLLLVLNQTCESSAGSHRVRSPAAEFGRLYRSFVA